MVEIARRSNKPAIGLCGDLFFGEAGPDTRREDTLVSKARSGSSSRGREKVPTGMKSVLPRSPGSLIGHCCITPAKLQHHKTCPLQINAYQAGKSPQPIP
jgi:hypothetical protein